MKQPFFSKKNLTILTSIVLVGYILISPGVFFVQKFQSESDKKRATAAYEKEQARLSANQKSINKAGQYLVDNITIVKPQQRLFLAYMQRKFDLSPVIGASGSPIDLYENPRTYPEEIHYLARVAYPDRLVNSVPKFDIEPVGITNIYGANCDRLPLPPNYWQVMKQNYKSGGYYLTHNALAFAFMKDNNCSIPNSMGDIKGLTDQGMVSIAEDKMSTPDLRYEAIAFLLLGGRYDLVDPGWISQIISEQQPDGSWKEKPGDTKSSDHATLLALWALLEYENPNKPYEPLIRH